MQSPQHDRMAWLGVGCTCVSVSVKSLYLAFSNVYGRRIVFFNEALWFYSCLYLNSSDLIGAETGDE